MYNSEQIVKHNIQKARSICSEEFNDKSTATLLQVASEIARCESVQSINTSLEEIKMELRSIADLIANQSDNS